VVASGNAALVLDTEQGKLDGKFTIDEGQFDARQNTAPKLDDDVVVSRASDAKETASEAQPAKSKFNWLVAVDVDAGQKLRVTGRGLDTGLRGKLRVSAPGNRMAINGSINTDNGTYAAYGQKLEIDRGIISFSGAVENPRLDILALRPNVDVRVGVSITGNVLTPRVRLFSEPDMSDADKLSWLVLGRAPEGLGRNDTALLQRAAVALLAGEDEAPTDALLKSLGIDDLSVRQGDTTVRETIISVGKQLGRRWYLGYERGVNATTGTWQLTYRIAQLFTLRAQSGLDNALDMIWTWRPQDPNKADPAKPTAESSVRKSIPAPP
jgi:translocation and assembly module TamB